MAAQNAFDAHHAWKLVFAPYIARANGSLVPGSVTLTDAAPVLASGQITALPVVVSACDIRHRLRTRATAVLIHPDRGSHANTAALETKPLASSAPSAAIRLIVPLKGRFSA